MSWIKKIKWTLYYVIFQCITLNEYRLYTQEGNGVNSNHLYNSDGTRISKLKIIGGK